MNFPELSCGKSCCQRLITASCELSTQVKPLPVWLMTSPKRGFAITLTQGRGVRKLVTQYSVPSAEK